MKGFWTTLFAILVAGSAAVADPMNICPAPPVLISGPISASGRSPAVNPLDDCSQNPLDSDNSSIPFSPFPAFASGTAAAMQPFWISSAVQPLKLRALTNGQFPSPAQELDPGPPSPQGINLQTPPPSDVAPSFARPIVLALLGIGVFGLTVPIFFHPQRDLVRTEYMRDKPVGSQAVEPVLASPRAASTGIPPHDSAEEILEASTRRCRYCTSRLVRASQKRNLLEKHVLSLIQVTPFRCMNCRRRYYGLAVSRRPATR